MQIKQNNPLQALKGNAAIKAHLLRARSLVLLCILIFGVGFYLGGYTPAPASIESGIKQMSRTNLTVWGMRRFSVQAPERSGWGHEWVMYQWFRKEGLISLRYDF
ncbi:MAG: hypothetical protein V2I56_15215, partial [Desulfobacteraceae bacterium]|nr:hypothetical protein [Desulfobacteraceae bacterium]